MVHIFSVMYAVANNFSTGRCQCSFQSRCPGLTIWLGGKSQRLLPQKVPKTLILCHVWWSMQLPPFPPSDPAQEHLLRRPYYPKTTLLNISLPTLPFFQYSFSTLQSIFLRHNLWHIIYCTYFFYFLSHLSTYILHKGMIFAYFVYFCVTSPYNSASQISFNKYFINWWMH